MGQKKVTRRNLKKREGKWQNWNRKTEVHKSIMWLDFFKKKLNAKGEQIVSSHNGNFVIPDRNGHKPQFLMPHPCIPPSVRPLFTTRYFGDIYTVTALKFEVDEKNVNGTNVVVIDSEVSVDYEMARENEAVIMFRNDICHFVWIEDEKKRITILHSLNHAEKVIQGVTNSWICAHSGMLKPPEYSELDKDGVSEIVLNAFDKPLSQLMEEAGAVVQNSDGQQKVTMGVT